MQCFGQFSVQCGCYKLQQAATLKARSLNIRRVLGTLTSDRVVELHVV